MSQKTLAADEKSPAAILQRFLKNNFSIKILSNPFRAVIDSECGDNTAQNEAEQKLYEECHRRYSGQIYNIYKDSGSRNPKALDGAIGDKTMTVRQLLFKLDDLKMLGKGKDQIETHKIVSFYAKLTNREDPDNSLYWAESEMTPQLLFDVIFSYAKMIANEWFSKIGVDSIAIPPEIPSVPQSRLDSAGSAKTPSAPPPSDEIRTISGPHTRPASAAAITDSKRIEMHAAAVLASQAAERPSSVAEVSGLKSNGKKQRHSMATFESKAVEGEEKLEIRKKGIASAKTNSEQSTKAVDQITSGAITPGTVISESVPAAASVPALGPPVTRDPFEACREIMMKQFETIIEKARAK